MERSGFTINEFGVVARRKRETYDTLAIREGYYLPPFFYANSDYIADILSGDKLVIIYASISL